MSIFGNKDKQGRFTINFASVQDTPLYEYPNFAISATLLEDKIEFKQRLGDKKVYLGYSQITKVEQIYEKDIIEKNKSVAKRAVVGGLLLGPLGAVVGAIDGTGKKKQTKLRNYLVFNYISNNNEEKALPLEIVGATLGLEKFLDKLHEICPNIRKENEEETVTYL